MPILFIIQWSLVTRQNMLIGKPGTSCVASPTPHPPIAGVREHGIKRLNVAGSRKSKNSGIHRWVTEVLEDAFFRSRHHPGTVGGPG